MAATTATTATTALEPAPAKPAAKPRTPAPAPAAELTPEQQRQWIAEAAYFLALKRGFTPEGALEDWLVAEQGLKDAMRKRAH